MMRTLSHAFDDLRANPMRNVLATFSVFIGVVSVVAIVCISTLVEEIQIAKVEQTYGRAATFGVTLNQSTPLSDEYINQYINQSTTSLSEYPSVLRTDISARYSINTTPPFYSPLVPAKVTAIAGDLTQLYRLPLIDGHWFDSTIVVPLQVVVNRAGREIYGGAGSAFSLQFTDNGQPHSAIITGVVADGVVEPQIYGSLLPLSAYNKNEDYFLPDSTLLIINAADADIDSVNEIAHRISTSVNATPDMSSLGRKDMVEFTLDELKAQQTGFFFAGGIALFVSSIGILNIGLASVKERAHELVVRRAVGARRGDLVGQVLLHAVILALIATILAAAITVIAIIYWVPQYIPYDSPVTSPEIPWAGFVIGLGAALLTTLVGSLIPALTASHLTIADALRA